MNSPSNELLGAWSRALVAGREQDPNLVALDSPQHLTKMELLLRTAGFTRWQILGGFDDRPLLHETDAMIVQAWTAPAVKEKT